MRQRTELATRRATSAAEAVGARLRAMGVERNKVERRRGDAQFERLARLGSRHRQGGGYAAVAAINDRIEAVKRESALVVDHDLSTGEFIGGLLEERGYKTTVATTYADGLSLFEATSPQLLVIDPRLSDGDGLALVLIAMPSARVVLTSAFPSGVANAAARLGVPVVVKPFEAERLLAQLS